MPHRRQEFLGSLEGSWCRIEWACPDPVLAQTLVSAGGGLFLERFAWPARCQESLPILIINALFWTALPEDVSGRAWLRRAAREFASREIAEFKRFQKQRHPLLPARHRRVLLKKLQLSVFALEREGGKVQSRGHQQKTRTLMYGHATLQGISYTAARRVAHAGVKDLLYHVGSMSCACSVHAVLSGSLKRPEPALCWLCSAFRRWQALLVPNFPPTRGSWPQRHSPALAAASLGKYACGAAFLQRLKLSTQQYGPLLCKQPKPNNLQTLFFHESSSSSSSTDFRTRLEGYRKETHRNPHLEQKLESGQLHAVRKTRSKVDQRRE